MREILAVAALILGFYGFIPYLRDILKGKVKPARSARIMFAALLVIALFQQHDLGSRYALAITIGEAAGSILILLSSLKYGVGGLKKLDVVCYVLLAADLFFWLTTSNSLIALHLTVLADLIAFTPTLEKTWHDPSSETTTFFLLGVIAPLLSIAASKELTYGIILFPAYLAIANGFEVLLIERKIVKASVK